MAAVRPLVIATPQSKEVRQSMQDNRELFLTPVPQASPRKKTIWYRNGKMRPLSKGATERAKRAGFPETINHPQLNILKTFGIRCWRVGDCYVAVNIVSRNNTSVFNQVLTLTTLETLNILTLQAASGWTTFGNLTQFQVAEHLKQMRAQFESVLDGRRGTYRHPAAAYLAKLNPLAGVRCRDIGTFDNVKAYLNARN